MLGDINRCSMRYTGDSMCYLDTPIRLNHFVNYFLDERIGKVGVFQVMHHGSKKNWHHGVAARIAPLFSVFSSDPEHRKFGPSRRRSFCVISGAMALCRLTGERGFPLVDG